MNFSLKPHQLVAHWVPGFLLLMVIAVLHPSASEGVKALLPHSDALSGFVLAVLAFAIAGTRLIGTSFSRPGLSRSRNWTVHTSLTTFSTPTSSCHCCTSPWDD